MDATTGDGAAAGDSGPAADDGVAAGDGGPAAGIRASDAERDATLQRLSAATGDGRLTLEEFSQRMVRATSAKTRAELDRLVTDLPADAAASSVVAERGPSRPSWHVSPIGGLSVSGPWRMERSVVVVTLIGGADLDLRQAQLAAPEVTLTKVSLLGGVSIGIPPGIRVDASGFSLIGGTSVDAGPDSGPGAPVVHVRAFSLIGGTRIYRAGPASQREDAAEESLMDRRARRRADRRSRRYR
jgi:hypothetical protein